MVLEAGREGAGMALVDLRWGEVCLGACTCGSDFDVEEVGTDV